jgi:hypothetical protein
MFTCYFIDLFLLIMEKLSYNSRTGLLFSGRESMSIKYDRLVTCKNFERHKI